jgi:hypothetical protein
MDLYYLEDQSVLDQLRSLNAQEEKSTTVKKVNQPTLTLNTPFHRALKERLERIKSGEMLSILFLRHQDKSGYFDLGAGGTAISLSPANCMAYYNWTSNTTSHQDSANFQVEVDGTLRFRQKRDRSLIRVGEASEGRVVVESNEFEQIVFYDHYLKRKV